MDFNHYNELLCFLEKESNNVLIENEDISKNKKILVVQTVKEENFEDILEKICKVIPSENIVILTEGLSQELLDKYNIKEDNVILHRGRYYEMEGKKYAYIIEDYGIDSVVFAMYRVFAASYINVIGFCGYMCLDSEINSYAYIVNECKFIKYRNLFQFYINYSAFVKMLELGIFYDDNKLFDVE